MGALTIQQVAEMISATEMLALFMFVNETYGGRDFQVLAVHRNGKQLSINIQVKGSGPRTVVL